VSFSIPHQKKAGDWSFPELLVYSINSINANIAFEHPAAFVDNLVYKRHTVFNAASQIIGRINI
jgi:hypothetical protein